jgi:hypothetical protein
MSGAATTLSRQHWRSRVAQFVPHQLRQQISATNLRAKRAQNAEKSVETVFSEIYSSGIWGDGEQFHSGAGSRGAAAAEYAALVRKVISAEQAKSIVDIGCGDFRVASQFVEGLDSYLGIDVVEHLTVRNTAAYGRPGIDFATVDASQSELPGADICLVRQVLQHLSNRQISGILQRCGKFPLVLVTEHWPSPDVASTPNRDKPHGPDTRLDQNSYVDIAGAPFRVGSVEEVLRMPVDQPLYHPGETIRTVMWRPSASSATEISES